jgi:hypothetical protein
MKRHLSFGVVVAGTLALLGGCDFLGAKQAAFDSP